MRTAVCSALIAAILFAGVAVAQQQHGGLKEGSLAPDIEAKKWLNTDDEEISIRQQRGLVIVVFFWIESLQQRGAKFSTDLLNIVAANPGLGEQSGVYVMGCTDADEVTADKFLKDAKATYPVATGSLAWKEYEIPVTPCVVIIDAEGKIAWSGYPGTTNFNNDEFINKLIETKKKTPPTRTHPAQARMARKYIRDAEDAIRKKKYRDAIKAGSNAIEHALSGDRLKNECQDILDLVDALGQDKLARGERMIDQKNFEEGIKTLREVMTEFRGSDAGRRARARLEALAKKHDQVKKLLDEQSKESGSQTKLALALDQIKKREFGDAYDLLEEIIAETPNGEAAKDAKTLMERMKKNDAVMGYVRDHQGEKDCGPLLSQARNYIKVKQFDKAKQLLNDILSKCPDTIYSEEALDELRNVP